VHHLRMNPDDRGLCALPMFHCFGQNAIMNALLTAGGTMVMHERFVPDAFVDAIAAHRITIFYAVPTMYILFLAMERPLDFASVRLYFSAAAILPTDVERRWHERFGRWIQQGYGLTETSPFASYNHDVGFKVFPREVEEVLFRHAAVKEAAVVGVPDAVRGEAVKAFVVLAEGTHASIEELQMLCRATIADYKVPGRIEFVRALPKNPTGKILKKDLRARADRIE